MLSTARSMASTGGVRRCGVCQGVAGGANCDEVTLVAECSHAFHFRCIIAGPAGTCPVCAVRWRQPLILTLRPTPSVRLGSPPPADNESETLPTPPPAST